MAKGLSRDIRSVRGRHRDDRETTGTNYRHGKGHYMDMGWTGSRTGTCAGTNVGTNVGTRTGTTQKHA